MKTEKKLEIIIDTNSLAVLLAKLEKEMPESYLIYLIQKLIENDYTAFKDLEVIYFENMDLKKKINKYNRDISKAYDDVERINTLLEKIRAEAKTVPILMNDIELKYCELVRSCIKHVLLNDNNDDLRLK